MYNDILDLAMDQQLIAAMSSQSKIDYKRFPIWTELDSKTEQDMKEFENKLDSANCLTFDILFNEPIGYYFMKLYLESQHSIDKAVFIRDVELFKSLRTEKAQKKASLKIYETYCTPESPNRKRGTSCLENNLNVINRPKNSSNVDLSKSGSVQISKLGSDITEFSRNNRIFSSNMDPPPCEQTVLTIEVQSHKIINQNSFSNSADTLHISIPNQIDEMKEDRPTRSIFFLDNSNTIGCTGKPLKKLKERIENGQCDINIFDEILRQILGDLKLDVFPRFTKSSLFDMYIRCKFVELKQINISSFRTMRMLGRGAFGSVNACFKKDTGKLYAMKQIDKRRVQETDSVNSLIAEKKFLGLMNSKFVTSLKYAFMDTYTIYLIMDLMSGGDLKFHLNKDGIFEEKRARFYCAQILLGLEHIHSKNIIYRDLKLENVLVDARGNVKISDLGLAISQTSNKYIRGYAGTPGYTAPRVVLTQYYDEKVDFFSFGVVVYRSISGRKPFGKIKKKHHFKINDKKNMKGGGNQSVELDRNVVEIEPPFDSSRFTIYSKNLCRALLNKNRVVRLGANGYDEIKQHPWFDSIDWALLETGYLKPPFIPTCDEIYAEQQHTIGRPPKDDKYAKTVIKKEFDESLNDFAYKSIRVIQEEIVELLKQAYDEQKKQSNHFNLTIFKLPAPHHEMKKRQCLSGCLIL